MLQSQFDQLQSAISTLFDIPSVNLTNDPYTNTNLILSTALEYGRKLIEVTEKLDEFHRRTATLHETHTYNKILDLYKSCGFRDQGNQTQQLMLERIRVEFKRNTESKKSVYSKSETKRTKKEVEFTKKEVTVIKDSIKKEEQLWKEIYIKVQLISQKYCQEKRFDRNGLAVSQELPSSFSQTLKQNISVNNINLSNMSIFLDNVLHGCLEPKSSKVNQLINEIQERQNVFSYSMSKLLESIRSLKNPMNKNTQQIHENITGLISKLFDIYPNGHLLRSLELKQEPSVINIKEYLSNSKEVQCNIKVDSKKDAEIKNINIAFYKFRVKIQQVIKKIQANIRMKKQLEAKEFQKYLQEMLNASTYHQNIQYSEVKSFQEELKIISQNFQQKQSQFREELQKNMKKANKSLHAYEQQLKSLKSQILNNQSNSQKLSKKVQSQKQEKQKLKQKLNQSERIINALQSQLQKCKQNLKSQHKQQLKQQKLLRAEYDAIIKQKYQREEEHMVLVDKLKLQEKLFDEERCAFISKVKIMEAKYQQTLFQNTQTKQCLQQMIGDYKLLKDKLQQFTGIHEDKIHECEAIGIQCTNLQNQLQKRHNQLKQNRINISAQKSLINSLQIQFQQIKQKLTRISKQKQSLQLECNRYKQLGKLNDDDIEALKQQFQKVHRSYAEVEAENLYLKSNLDSITVEHARLTEIQQRCNTIIHEREAEIRQIKRQLIQFEDQVKFLKQQNKLKESQLQELIKSSDMGRQEKKEIARLKRQNSQFKSSLTTWQLQYNIAKQELQNVIQQQERKKSLQSSQLKSVSSRHQLQVQSLKIQLKNKKQSWQKQKLNYERQKQIYCQKIQQLNKLLQQKQNLSHRVKAFKS